jgi:Wadjet anti plasmid transformation system JetA-like protein
MAEAGRRVATLRGARRREWHGEGGGVPDGVRRLLECARGGRACRWEGIGRRIGAGCDQVDAERLLWAAVDGGLAVVRERQNRRGDWEPYQWRLTERGELLVARATEAVDVSGYLSSAEDPNHPVLAAIRAWLERRSGNPAITRLVLAIGEELRAGRLPRDRLLSMRLVGTSKALRPYDLRDELEAALGLPFDDLVRASGRAVVVAGPIRFRAVGIETDARGVPPWLALPTETIDQIERLSVDADRLLTIENLAVFEEEVRRGLGPNTAALYLGGFAGRLERRMLDLLVAAGVKQIDHWSDLDLGGLRILRHLQSIAPVEVRPFRMDPALLEQLPTKPLTENDRAGLKAWIDDQAAPHRDLAQALVHADRKAEQEGWFLLPHR